MKNNKKCILGLFLLLMSSLLVNAQETKPSQLNLVFIGNSITQGALLSHPEEEAPPAQTAAWLRKQQGIEEVNIVNMGISGLTTVDFLPASETYFPKLMESTRQLVKNHPDATLIFSIMIGTNDSAIKGPNGAPVSPPQYYTNLKVIIDALLSEYPNAVFVLHRPIWYSPNTYNGAMYLKEGLMRLDSYFPQIQKFVKDYASIFPGQFHLGDVEAFDYFRVNYEAEFVHEEGYAGTFYLHPNRVGARNLAIFWGKAIYRIL